jgi:hypothetical protein
MGEQNKSLEFVVRALAWSETIKIRWAAGVFLDLVVNEGDH